MVPLRPNEMGLLQLFHYNIGQAFRGPLGFQNFRKQSARSAQCTGHYPPSPPENIPGTHFCCRLSRPPGSSAVGRIMPMKNFSDNIGNRTRDLLACSAVSQPTAPPRDPGCQGVQNSYGPSQSPVQRRKQSIEPNAHSPIYCSVCFASNECIVQIAFPFL